MMIEVDAALKRSAVFGALAWLFEKLNTVTGRVKLGSHSGPLKRGDVYSRGCAAEFIQRMGLAGKDILYVGDHIFGDVLKSKKVGGWRTLLIVPELDNEMKVGWKKLFYYSFYSSFTAHTH
ncbi:hypothetical protein Y032_0054g2511 [Ancylostoma ceylanicum]|uniref:5' nucleotidase family protein n=1 Tax=Ancylostoma ceylanicum TaxID=53326 RepID=A0A016U5W3_9BILA|nr:hypothetical protein Y032_0054g2511 [Ancylostoma ceylanicum]